MFVWGPDVPQLISGVWGVRSTPGPWVRAGAADDAHVGYGEARPHTDAAGPEAVADQTSEQSVLRSPMLR